jgi:hypothetical protein
VLGALIGLGIPEEEAVFYRDEFEAGRVLVTVRAGDRASESAAVLRRHGAYDVTGRAAPVTPPAPRHPDATGTPVGVP